MNIVQMEPPNCKSRRAEFDTKQQHTVIYISELLVQSKATRGWIELDALVAFLKHGECQ